MVHQPLFSRFVCLAIQRSLAMILYRDVRLKPQDSAWISLDRRKVTGMLAGKPCRPSFPHKPGSPPPACHLREREFSKEKKSTIQSAKALEKLIAAPIPIRGKDRRWLSGGRAAAGPRGQDGLAPQDRRGLGPASPPPASGPGKTPSPAQPVPSALGATWDTSLRGGQRMRQ